MPIVVSALPTTGAHLPRKTQEQFSKDFLTGTLGGISRPTGLNSFFWVSDQKGANKRALPGINNYMLIDADGHEAFLPRKPGQRRCGVGT